MMIRTLAGLPGSLKQCSAAAARAAARLSSFCAVLRRAACLLFCRASFLDRRAMARLLKLNFGPANNSSASVFGNEHSKQQPRSLNERPCSAALGDWRSHYLPVDSISEMMSECERGLSGQIQRPRQHAGYAKLREPAAYS